MAKSPMPTKGDQQPIDERPDDVTDNNLEDGLEELEAAEEAAADATQAKRDEDEEEQKKPAVEYEEDPRADIEEEFFAKRADKDQPADDDAEEPADEKTAKAEDDATEDPDEVITAKVDGKIEKITRAELEKRLAEYQRYGTAEKRLQEASELLKQAKELKSAAPEKTPTDEKAESKPDTSTKDDDASVDDLLAKVGEKLQFGDTQEVVEALKTVISQAQRGQQQQAPAITPETVTQTVLEVEEQKRSDAALKAFDSENKELNENPRLQRLVQGEISDIMRNDIRELARNRGRSQEEIDQIDTLTDLDVAKAHRAMRMNGLVARDTAAVLRDAKDNLVKANLWPGAKPATSEDRTARKQSAMQQPASRTRSQPAQSQQRQAAVQTTSEIVAEEQAARGNPAY